MIDNSTDRTIDVFFYGLYMEAAILEEKGVVPRNPRVTVVEDFALRIGQQATLIRVPGSHAYGVVFALTHGELHQLYWGAGLDTYRAEPVLARLSTGGCIPALCYNLLEPPPSSDENIAYLQRLQHIMRQLGLPADQ